MASSPTTRTHPNRLLAVLLIAPFMAQADATIANVAAPSIHADLHTTGAELELVIGSYLIAFAVLLITGRGSGRSTDIGACSCSAWASSRAPRCSAASRPGRSR